jgi:hypothetical protein
MNRRWGRRSVLFLIFHAWLHRGVLRMIRIASRSRQGLHDAWLISVLICWP